MDWHREDVSAAIEALGSSLSKGLSEAEAAARILGFIQEFRAERAIARHRDGDGDRTGPDRGPDPAGRTGANPSPEPARSAWEVTSPRPGSRSGASSSCSVSCAATSSATCC